MTAWAYIICEKMGFDRLESLSLGKAHSLPLSATKSYSRGSIDIHLGYIDEARPRPGKYL
jgi:hypothetical protein